MTNFNNEESVSVHFQGYRNNPKWVFCPNPHCHKRLFEIIESNGFVIEIKCRNCKKLVRIEKGEYARDLQR